MKIISRDERKCKIQGIEVEEDGSYTETYARIHMLKLRVLET